MCHVYVELAHLPLMVAWVEVVEVFWFSSALVQHASAIVIPVELDAVLVHPAWIVASVEVAEEEV